MDDREFDQEFPSTATEAKREQSPMERLLLEVGEELNMLNEQVSLLKKKVRPVSASHPEMEKASDERSMVDTEPRVGSSPYVDKLYEQRAQIRRVRNGVREVLNTLEV